MIAQCPAPPAKMNALPILAENPSKPQTRPMPRDFTRKPELVSNTQGAIVANKELQYT